MLSRVRFPQLSVQVSVQLENTAFAGKAYRNTVYISSMMSFFAPIQEEAHQKPNEGGSLFNRARYRKTVSIALWVQMTLLASYVPYGIISLIALTGLRSPTFNLAWDSTLTLLFLNSTLNPFLYYWKMRHLRQAVMATIRRFFCCSLTVACVQ